MVVFSGQASSLCITKLGMMIYNRHARESWPGWPLRAERLSPPIYTSAGMGGWGTTKSKNTKVATTETTSAGAPDYKDSRVRDSRPNSRHGRSDTTPFDSRTFLRIFEVVQSSCMHACNGMRVSPAPPAHLARGAGVRLPSTARQLRLPWKTTKTSRLKNISVIVTLFARVRAVRRARARPRALKSNKIIP